MEQGIRSIGILGAGRVGTAVAREALKARFEVRIATAKPVEDIALIVEIITPGALAVTAAEAAQADLVVLALPLHKYRTLDSAALAGRVVIDAMNYWEPTDGTMPELAGRGSSEVIQDFLAASHVVKTLNHIGYHELEADGCPAGSPGRRALAVAGDDPDARGRVLAFIDALGYDAVDAGSLAAGRALEPGTEAFAGAHDAAGLAGALGRHAASGAGSAAAA
ncbi:NADP oxidoreductase [Sinomonas atrocyanea]|uniref:NADP oxidoreductase n=2 Tax=Sinomonas atrocyanea TaxID=37927 RepID=A0A127A4V5_9MICC|nr:NAD(P)-binding domain-containing protein [Sinomonas atrocyanea]AMM34353.1 NADP oxidoreductase [Sinomonas atrocyanea]GEB64566.1 NADP oxidoreductase [Sinomonas atrocyanea]